MILGHYIVSVPENKGEEEKKKSETSEQRNHPKLQVSFSVNPGWNSSNLCVLEAAV